MRWFRDAWRHLGSESQLVCAASIESLEVMEWSSSRIPFLELYDVAIRIGYILKRQRSRSGDIDSLDSAYGTPTIRQHVA